MAEPPDGIVRTLFDRRGAALRRFLRARFGGETGAGDIAREAWVRMHRVQHPEQLENARVLLSRTAADLAVNRLRRVDLERRRFEADEDGVADAPRDLRSQARSLDGDQQLALVDEAIAELPARCREAFLLHRVQGLSYPEIARQIGASTPMVEQYVIRALKHCRRRLEAGNRFVAPENSGRYEHR